MGDNRNQLLGLPVRARVRPDRSRDREGGRRVGRSRTSAASSRSPVPSPTRPGSANASSSGISPRSSRTSIRKASASPTRWRVPEMRSPSPAGRPVAAASPPGSPAPRAARSAPPVRPAALGRSARWVARRDVGPGELVELVQEQPRVAHVATDGRIGPPPRTRGTGDAAPRAGARPPRSRSDTGLTVLRHARPTTS